MDAERRVLVVGMDALGGDVVGMAHCGDSSLGHRVRRGLVEPWEVVVLSITTS